MQELNRQVRGRQEGNRRAVRGGLPQGQRGDPLTPNRAVAVGKAGGSMVADVVAGGRAAGAAVRIAPAVAAPFSNARRRIVERFAAGDRAVLWPEYRPWAPPSTLRSPRNQVSAFQRPGPSWRRAVGVGDFPRHRRSSGNAVRAVGRYRPRRFGSFARLRHRHSRHAGQGLSSPAARPDRYAGRGGFEPACPAFFLPLVGHGEAELGGRVMPGARGAGAPANIKPPVLGPKDAIRALLKRQCLQRRKQGALALHDAGLAPPRRRTAAGAFVARGRPAPTLSPIDPRVVALRTGARTRPTPRDCCYRSSKAAIS